ncbi:MAG: riboflavin biosynthesis protein RibF [Clostridia bacterium]|nr:riboflavin biosynthesis protein RibF [Clostridia bacterium]
MFTKKAIALGTFDGIHSGHRAVLKTAQGLNLTVLTFRIPPKSSFSDSAELLMLPEDKEKYLLQLGAEKIEFLDFEKIKNITALDFLRFVSDTYKPDRIICGYDFHFGKNAEGNAELIKDFCKENGMDFIITPPVSVNNKPISSTDLRHMISNGDLENANGQIFGGFGFSSPVLHGDKRGRTIGFPTINQEYPELLIRPKFGVYASEMIIDGISRKCITNIGFRPTFHSQKVLCESFVFDFNEEIYGKNVTLKPKRFLRGEKRFSSVDELKSAIKDDIAKL